jgi:hypothetical protein
MEINRVRDPKTHLRADRRALMHFCEFARFDSAILEKPKESLPPGRTVVKRSGLAYRFYRVEIHLRELNLRPLCVTRRRLLSEPVK